MPLSIFTPLFQFSAPVRPSVLPLLLLLLLLLLLCSKPQRLRDFQPDAVMAVGMPASVMGDNLACLLSHALGGVPFIDINGNALLTGPTNVPQV
jgi:hypothetical protein